MHKVAFFVIPFFPPSPIFFEISRNGGGGAGKEETNKPFQVPTAGSRKLVLTPENIITKWLDYTIVPSHSI